MAWKTIELNSNAMVKSAFKAVLIKLPHSKMKFWHPIKLVKQKGKNGYKLMISFTDDWIFKIFRNGEGRYNQHEIIEERKLNGDELINEFQLREVVKI